MTLQYDPQFKDDSGTKMPSLCFVSFAPQVHELLAEDPAGRSGGAGLQQVLVCRELAGKGLNITFVVPFPDSAPKEFHSDGVNVLAAIRPARGLRFIRACAPALSTLRALRKADSQVYHVWGAFGATGYVALYSMLSRKPFIFNIYNNRDVDGGAIKGLRALDRLLYRFAIKRASAIFAETEQELELLKRNFGREGILIRNLCHVPEDADARTKRDVVLWVGQFRETKRPELFVNLAGRFPEYQFAMVGGPHASRPSLYEDLMRKAEKLPNLVLTGQLSLQETWDYCKRAYAHVLTSSAEGFPNVILEAWREGTPVVSTFDPDGVIAKYGLGYCAEDLDGLEAGLRKLLDDEQSRIAMGERAITYVREHHDPQLITQQILQVVFDLNRRSAEVRA